VALAALLLTIGLVACGGGGNSDSTTDSSPSPQQPAGSQANSPASDQEPPGGAGKSAEASKPSGADGGEPSHSNAENFVPKQHHDSGGGAEQFRVKGGDNSIQEFGSEAGGSKLDEAATALHNFLDARAAGNLAAACAYLSKSVVESFEQLVTRPQQSHGIACAGVLRKILNPSAKRLFEEEAEQADVGSLRTEGEQAFLIYRGIDGAVLAMPMAREDGAWKVASLTGTPLS
jgi:hypothetical protein